MFANSCRQPSIPQNFLLLQSLIMCPLFRQRKQHPIFLTTSARSSNVFDWKTMQSGRRCYSPQSGQDKSLTMSSALESRDSSWYGFFDLASSLFWQVTMLIVGGRSALDDITLVSFVCRPDFFVIRVRSLIFMSGMVDDHSAFDNAMHPYVEVS